MILTENIILLKKMFPDVWEKMKEFDEKNPESKIETVQSKSGLPTLVVRGKRDHYIHSKYDPQNEAERFISQYQDEDMEKYGHVFFYGIGLGYHVLSMMKRFPDKTFSIYEPSPEVFCRFISSQDLRMFPLRQWKNLFVEFDSKELLSSLNLFVDRIKDTTVFIPLPFYERYFGEEYKHFQKQFIEKIKQKRLNLFANWAYEKRWVINSVLNLSELIKTPNILHDFDKNLFRNKPVLLVAAGPSLEGEYENLRSIKEHGSAYIFAVGSAIKALVKNGIFPDAVCAHDPNTFQQVIFSGLSEEDIKQFPLIYSSSVGFETVKNYPGFKTHMISNQDTVSPYYLKRIDKEEIKNVNDAPSVAVVTLQLLAQLEANPIILVGQNLAYSEDKVYAGGIDHYQDDEQKKRIEKAKSKKCIVENVYGEMVYSDDTFIAMRKNMEYYISLISNEVINTTKGGVKIKGTEFIPLEQLIENRLSEGARGNFWWCSDSNPAYDRQHIIEKQNKMNKAYQECRNLMGNLEKIIKGLNDNLSYNKETVIDKLLVGLDKNFKKISKNIYFKHFLHPMNRVRFDLITQNISEIQEETDIVIRAEKVIKHFGRFIEDCNNDMNRMHDIFNSMLMEIDNK